MYVAGMKNKYLVMINSNSVSALHTHAVCENRNISLLIISKMIEVRRQKLVMTIVVYNGTTLHAACTNNENISLEMISMLVEIRGHELGVKKELQ